MDLEASLVRIWTKDKRRIVGSGFLVAEKGVLTCAHVVAQSLGIEPTVLKKPEEEISLDFPLIEPGNMLSAKVVSWFPKGIEEDGDLAYLGLLQKPSQEIVALPLIPEENVWGHQFRAFGYPDKLEKGIWVQGKLLAKVADGWVQIDGVKNIGFFIQPGFSGTPIWDETVGGVVGIAVTAEKRKELKTAFIIPSSTVLGRIPALKPVGNPSKSPEIPNATKFDILRILYKAYRDAPGEWFSSSQVCTELNIRHTRLNELILALLEQEFIDARFLDDRSLLRITSTGVKILEEFTEEPQKFGNIRPLDEGVLKQLEHELNIQLREIDFKIITQGGSGYALDEDGSIIGLNLHNLHLLTVPAEVLQFQRLRALSLFHNNLTQFPKELLTLPQLQRISLSQNCITSLPREIVQLKHLEYLDVTANKLTTLPEKILKLELELRWEGGELFQNGIFLEDNPFELPPVEIVKQGHENIVQYFLSLKKKEKHTINEVKVLLVGDGGAGKTSLLRRLSNEGFNSSEPQTHGLNIKSLPLKEKSHITVNCWDFGGQEIMHATHRFFFSKRSLYILVLDGRKDEKAEYWLQYIKSFGGDSPILVVINKIDENPGFDVNRRFLQTKYPGLKGFYRISCATKEGVQEFLEGLSHILATTEMPKTIWPSSWLIIKDKLEQMTSPFIDYDEYQNMCHWAGILDPQDQETLVEFLNDLGVIVHFKDFSLQNVHVLEPRWLTEGVYKILNSGSLAEHKGVLELKNLKAILQKNDDTGYEYPSETFPYLVALMRKFELCFRIDEQNVLIPDLLDIQEPIFGFKYSTALRYVIEYDFLPRSVMPSVMVRMHNDIKDDLRWRTGVVLQEEGADTIAVIRSDHEAEEISIFINGTRKHYYLPIILHTFRKVNDSFEHLNAVEKVPMPDAPEVMVSYQHLLKLEETDHDTYFPDGAEHAYRVKELLGYVRAKG